MILGGACLLLSSTAAKEVAAKEVAAKEVTAAAAAAAAAAAVYGGRSVICQSAKCLDTMYNQNKGSGKTWMLHQPAMVRTTFVKAHNTCFVVCHASLVLVITLVVVTYGKFVAF